MLIITLRTDKPEAEIGLWRDGHKIAYATWEAHRQLAETIHSKIEAVLNSNDLELSDIEGIVVYQGPGSFTGLRIGLTVANTLSYALSVPISGQTGEDWVVSGQEILKNGKGSRLALPEYGAAPHITAQKH
jgi:tRNA threonylcarbamoyladenosine biosynthesis protein TsaB